MDLAVVTECRDTPFLLGSFERRRLARGGCTGGGGKRTRARAGLGGQEAYTREGKEREKPKNIFV